MLVEILDERIAGIVRYTCVPEGEALPYLHPNVLHTVCFIGYEDEQGNEKLAGTAFWVVRRGPEDIAHLFSSTYLVTATHVLDGIRKKSPPSSARVRLRVNTSDGRQKWVDTPLDSWRTHPDESVDVAVLKIQLAGTNWNHFAWPTSGFVHSESSDEDGGRSIGHGDDLFIAGLFYHHSGTQRNVPIVRMANIAALREEPIKFPDGTSKDAYLVECHSIGGLSGSPVFYDVRAAKQAFQGAERFMKTTNIFRLLGLIHGHFDFEDKSPDTIIEDGKERFSINSGIAIVTPAEKIMELLDTFQADEAAAADECRQNKQSSVVLD